MDNITRLNDYILGRKLGTGQFSKVREGIRGACKYAVKYLNKGEGSSLSAQNLDLVINEVKVLSSLDHPYLVRLHEYGDKGVIKKSNGKSIPVIYMVLDLITGGELFDYVAVGGRFSDKMARYYFRQLIEVLEYMHSKGFAHRDIKAENVLLDFNYNLKLADFGFSAPIGGKDGSGVLYTYKGTRNYMAPEIIVHKGYIGEKVDLFATGVLLFILIAQHPPFREASFKDGYYKLFCQENKNYWAKVCTGKPSGIFSPELKELINGLLSPNPDFRPTIEQIKACAWLNGPLPTPEEVRGEFKIRREKIELSWKEKEAEAIAKKMLEGQNNGAEFGFSAHAVNATKKVVFDTETAAAKGKLLPLYEPVVSEQTILFTMMEPTEVITILKERFESQEFEVKESAKTYKLKVKATVNELFVVFEIRMEKISEHTRCIRINRVAGDKMDFLELFGDIRDFCSDTL